MQRLALGHRASFRPLFDELWPMVFRFSLKFLKNRQDAEDASQQALQKLFQQAHKFEHGGSVVAWSIAITTWECKTLRKKIARRNETEFVSQEKATTQSPEKKLEEKEVLEQAEMIIGNLSEKDRNILLKGLNHQRPTPATPTERKQKQRILDRLKAQWRRYE